LWFLAKNMVHLYDKNFSVPSLRQLWFLAKNMVPIHYVIPS
jgi:hypothetical protein